ncbi:hypothetical protein M885DRAFT_518709 [Pelagophyceae sp. CCMP2097]|nr:hypothetical protein M885DRAFT_518709 [Pelagophyceae sp. CCMP2097]
MCQSADQPPPRSQDGYLDNRDVESGGAGRSRSTGGSQCYEATAHWSAPSTTAARKSSTPRRRSLWARSWRAWPSSNSASRRLCNSSMLKHAAASALSARSTETCEASSALRSSDAERCGGVESASAEEQRRKSSRSRAAGTPRSALTTSRTPCPAFATGSVFSSDSTSLSRGTRSITTAAKASAIRASKGRSWFRACRSASGSRGSKSVTMSNKAPLCEG